jgi:hypothetical protein
MNHHNTDDRASVREWLKLVFNGALGARQKRIASQQLAATCCIGSWEDVIAWLQHSYAPAAQALEPASFKL